MFTYSFYNDETDLIIESCINYSRRLKIGDTITLKGKIYKISGSSSTLGIDDDNYKGFYVYEQDSNPTRK